MELVGTRTSHEGKPNSSEILLNCVKPTPESIFGNVPDLNIVKAILDANIGVNGRKCVLQAAADLIGGTADFY